MPKEFLRQDYMRHSKIGKGRKKLQKWRKPKGRHSKIRQKLAGYPKSPSVGYKKDKKILGKINGLVPVRVYNMKDLERADKNSAVIIGKVGAKKRMDLIKKADEMKLKIINVGGKNATK